MNLCPFLSFYNAPQNCHCNCRFAPLIRIRIEIKRWIRVRILNEANADPQHCKEIKNFFRVT
jgi:hypothetical protein